eukprot:COSAG02_NODE_19_length_53976_cov_37.338512_31_plen_73_part_00
MDIALLLHQLLSLHCEYYHSTLCIFEYMNFMNRSAVEARSRLERRGYSQRDPYHVQFTYMVASRKTKRRYDL